MEWKQKLYDEKLDILFAFVIGVVSLYNLGNLTQLYVLHDEFGYWANAAMAVGYDWSEVAMMSPYYSYGYSLVLIPLMLLFHNPVWMYRAAVVLNAAMYLGSYFVSLWCAGKLLPHKNRDFRSVICLVIAFYGNNLLQVQFSWGEAMLYLIFWILFATLIKYLAQPRIRWILCMGLEAGFLYAVHQRTLGVAVALMLTMVMIFTRNKKIPWKKIFISIIAVILLAVLVVMIKQYIQNRLWNWQDEELAGHNDYAGQLEKLLIAVTSLEGIQKLLCSFAGKLFGVIMGSCGLVVSFLWKSGKSFFAGRKEKGRILCFFLMASLFMMLGVSAVFWINGVRLDGVVYSRYTEFVMGPVLLIALGHLFEKSDDGGERIFYVALVLVCGIVTMGAMEGLNTFTRIHNVAGSMFYDGEENTFSVLPCMAFLLLFGILMYLAKSAHTNTLYALTAVIAMTFWFASSRNVLVHEVNDGQIHLKELSILVDAIEAVDKDAPIYYLVDPDMSFLNRRVENVQFLMPQKKIYRAQLDELDQLEGEYYLLQYGVAGIDPAAYEVAVQAYGMVLLVPADSELAERFLEYQKENPYEFLNTQMYSETARKQFVYDSDYEEGFVVGCQYLVLDPGKYQAVMKIQVSESKDPNLGFYDVSYDYGENLLFSHELKTKALDEDGEATLVYNFYVQERVEQAEIRLYSYGNSKMEMQELSIRRIN